VRLGSIIAPGGTDLESCEREALQAFIAALPNLPKEIKVSGGRAFCWLHQTGTWPYEDDTCFAEYVMAVPNSASPLPK
jgi:hypothetical protein